MENRHTTFPTPYPDLNRVLRDFVDRVQALLSTNFVGAYLQGSFAVGDFDLHSDVDFIMVIAEDLSHEEVHALQAFHEQIYGVDIPWAQHLEGSYFPIKVLRDHARLGDCLPPEHLARFVVESVALLDLSALHRHGP